MSNTPLTPQDLEHLKAAAAWSRRTMESDKGGPFGAVIVKEGVVIGEGGNEVTSSFDPTAHAEVVAIRRACQKVGDFNLEGATIYSSCEPCPMCLSAIYWAGLSRLVYANTRDEAEAIGFIDAKLYRELHLEPSKRSLTTTHCQLEEARAVFADWIKKTDRVDY